jgi:hypothetical protein
VAAEAKKEKAPEFVLTTFDKKRISLSDSGEDQSYLNSLLHGDPSASRRLLL